MNSKELAADLHRSGRDQHAVGIPDDDALQSIQNVFRSRFGAKREPVVKRRDEGPPALAVEELAESDFRAIHDLVAPVTPGSVPPRQSGDGSPCLELTPPVGRNFAGGS